MTKLFFHLFWLLIFSHSSFAYRVVNIEVTEISYTQEEVNWLKNAPEIIVVSQITETPNNFNELKSPISAETALFLNEIEHKTGLTFNHITNLSWKQVAELLEQKAPVIIPAVSYHKDLDLKGLYTPKYDSVELALFTYSENKEISSLSSLNGKTLILTSAKTDPSEIKNIIPNVIIVEQNNVIASVNSILEGKADALIGDKNIIYRVINKNEITGIQEIKQQLLPEKGLHFLTNGNDKVLNSIISKAINKINDNKVENTNNLWHSFYYNSDSSVLINIIGILCLCLFIVYIAYKKERSKLIFELDKTNNINKEIARLKKEDDLKNKHQAVALEGSDEGIWDWDVRTETYYLTTSWLNLLGYEKNQIKPNFESYLQLINSEHTEKVLTDYEKLFQGTVQKIKHEYQIEKGNGEWLWIETRGRVVGRDENEKPCRFAGIHLDISERKSIEEKLSLTKQSHSDHISRLDQQNREMKKTQSRLMESENKAKSIIEMAKEAIVVINSHSKIVSWNKGAEKLFGYSANEMDWKPLEKVIPDDYNQSYFAGMDTNTKAIELEGLHKDGYKIPIELASNSWKANDGTYSSSIIRDLTERKKMEHALNEQFKKIEDSQLFLNTLFDIQKQMLIVTTGQKIQDVNQFFLDFFEVSDLKEFTLQHNSISELFKPHTSNKFLQPKIVGVNWIDHVIDNPEKSYKAIIAKKNQDYIFDVGVVSFNFNNETLFLTVFSDITELEKAKKLTEESLEFTEQLIEGLSSPFYFQDKDYKFQKVNSALCKLLGKSKREIISNTILDILEKDAADHFHKSDKKLLKESTQIDEITINHPTRGAINIIVYKAAMYDENHDFNGVIGLIIDITQRKTIEKELAESKALMTGSIEYSSLIQQAIIPETTLFKKYFNDFFIIWKPRDVVGGDIFFLDELRNQDECLIMVIDCTGHGVPGAFVTMLVKAVERQIINNILLDDKVVSTAYILQEFNSQIKSLLRQHNEDAISNAGFDGGILYINFKEKIARYSGAETPLFVVQNNKLSQIKGDRHSIGYKKSDVNYQFTEHVVNIAEPTKFYLSTDGYFDQNGGEKGFPLGKKAFINQLEQFSSDSFSTQKTKLLEKLDSYRKAEDVNDDITLIGLSIEK